MAKVYLSLGSNLGDRQANLQAAIDRFPAAGIQLLRVSPVYETEPVDYLDQPSFLNLVVEVETELAPCDLLSQTTAIEKELGRVRNIPKGPRTIDIDILFYDEAVIETPTLTIPHPRLAERRFVLVPLNDLEPNLRHPVTKQTVQELLSIAPPQKVAKHGP
ncbi:MAG TPA: 2-amino-4-hydroxy-6-hydroxymethyldihydropteridine diphosphokinase [Candidatus Limnocylindrales bacterium]|nr:2-amino-4-hydroxy-6-hydroxymethyldihydropteridine diphosphokinase [Candidatus Limnocylindrales bacterium]